jgi:hypothetical protein
MKIDWELEKNNIKAKFLADLKKPYEQDIDKASDKKYIHDKYMDRIKKNQDLQWNKEENTIIQENYVWIVLNNIEDLKKSDKKYQYNYSGAFEKCVNSITINDTAPIITLTQKQKKETIKILAKWEGYEDYKTYIMEQDKIYNPVNEGNIISENITSELSSNPQFTTARQVLAIYYLMKQLHIWENSDKTEIARFIQFLTGKESKTEKIKNTNIYKYLRNPLKANDKSLNKDLLFIRKYFQGIGMSTITEAIDKEIKASK